MGAPSAELAAAAMGDVPHGVGAGWCGSRPRGCESCWSVKCVAGNKMAIRGSCLAGGPVKNHPLNMFQLSKHRCLPFLLFVCVSWGKIGRAGCASTSASSSPELLCFVFHSLFQVMLGQAVGSRAVKEHQPPSFTKGLFKKKIIIK